MMKKFVAMILAVCMMAALCAPALGEGCYTSLVAIFSSEESDDLYLGEDGYYFTPETSDNYLLIFYDFEAQRLVISGENNDGQPEASYWNNVNDVKGLYVIYTLCSSWDYLESMIENGSQLILALELGGDNGSVCITSSSEAAAFISNLDALINGEE